MKKFRNFLALLTFIIIYKLCYTQTTIYTQNFGNSPLPVVVFPTGWSTTNGTSGWTMDNGNPSSGYTGASGGYNVKGPIQSSTLIFSSISTIGYNNITVLWATYRPSIIATPAFQWSTDSITWNTVSYTNNTVNTWDLINGGVRISLPAGASGAAQLFLRWTLIVTVSSLNPFRFDDVTIEGTPTTTNPPAKIAVLSVNYGLNPDSCHAFDVIVQSQDANGNPANVTFPQLVTLSKLTGNGTGVLTGGTGTIQSNTNVDTITVNYSQVETGVSLLASAPSLTSDTSNVFNVLPCLPLVPASLPTCYEWQHTGNIMVPYPTGWYNYGLDSSTLTGYAIPYCGQFDNQNDSLVIYFNSPPDSLVCWLRAKNLSGNFLFEIKESGANHVYSNIATFSMSSAVLGNTWSHHAYSLNNTSRYMKFVYTTMATGNILIDSVCIYPYAAPPVASKLKIISVNGGLNPDSCSVFNVIIQSHDVNNNVANVTTDTKVSLSVNTGNSTSLGGTISDTIHSGTNTLILPITYNKIQAGISLIVSRISGDTLSSDTSGLFNVLSCLTNININDFDKDIEIFPNPANSSLFISHSEIIERIDITDIYGQQIKDFIISGNISNVPLNNLPEGLYIISFYKKDGNLKKLKFIKQ